MWLLLVNRYSYRVYFLIITWNGQQSTLLWMHLYKSLLRIYNMFDITNWYFIYKYFHFDEVSVVLNQFLLQSCFEKLKSQSSFFFWNIFTTLPKRYQLCLLNIVNGSTRLRKILKWDEKITRANIDFQLVAMLLLNYFWDFRQCFAFLRVTLILFLLKSISLLPSSGLLSVTGIIAETMFKNIVKLSRIVTPGKLCSLKSNELVVLHDNFHLFNL